MKRFRLYCLLILLITFITSCLFKKLQDDEGIGTDPSVARFTAAKEVIAAKCAGCHGTSGGVSFSTDAAIIAKATRIKDRAVDRGDMPPNAPLSLDEKKKIYDWVTDGGRLIN